MLAAANAHVDVKMAPEIIIGLTGFARSGKDTAARYLRDKYGFRIYTFSDILREELSARGLPTNKEEMSKFGDELRSIHGDAVLADRLIKKIDKEGPRRVIANGFRSPGEVQVFRGKFAEKFLLVDIWAPAELRFKRKSAEDLQSWDEFFARDKRELANKGMAGVIEAAQARVINDSDVASLQRKIDDMMAALGLKAAT